MQTLLEVHDQAEMNRVLRFRPEIIGINNRNLKTMKTDINTTYELIKNNPVIKKSVIVSESGISTRNEVQSLARTGVNAILVGESLLASDNIQSKVKEILGG